MLRTRPLITAFACVSLLGLAASCAWAGERPAVGDTLTVVMRPILSVPAIVTPGGSFTIEAKASPSASAWAATLTRASGASHALVIDSASYLAGHERWFLAAAIPPDVPAETYDLEVSASGGVFDEVAHCVTVRQSIDEDFYFVQITDPHLPTHLYYYQSGADTDTTEMEDMHAVIDDINIMNPDFVLLTGDVVNEGELEDFLDKRYFTKAHRILRKLDVPVFVVAGNHDVGGWEDSPPPDGTARRNWWKFFGWRYLSDPPPDDGLHTQNYSFDYGGAHFIGIEAYVNYDRWRRQIYGDESFTDAQLDWLIDDLATVSPGTPTIAFYHMDFQDQLDLGDLGIDCALWGHIHHSSGSTSSPPYNLSLDNVCDGDRAMRVVRIVGGSTVVPSEPIVTGYSGEKLRLTYAAPNDGTVQENTATVTNANHEDFEHGLVKFRVDANSMPYEVDNGEITQVIVEGGTATYYVEVTFPEMTATTVTISTSTGVPDGSPNPSIALLAPAWPNPARATANLSFLLPASQHVRATVLDVRGRLVAELCDERLEGGPHRLAWDLSEEPDVASGIYFYRVESEGQEISGKIVVLR